MYGARMARVNITVPDELLDRARAAKLQLRYLLSHGAPWLAQARISSRCAP